MSRPTDDCPEPLLKDGATDFERRLLEGGRAKGPSAAATARMAKALGLTAGVVTSASAARGLAADALAAKGGAAAGASALWAWVSVGVLGLGVTAAVVGFRARHAPSPVPAVAGERLPRPAEPSQPPFAATEAAPSLAPGAHRSRAQVPAELSDQIALIDGARAALAGGTYRRALETLRRYQDRYPNGNFRPEATALKIEVLVRLGRMTEARALADRFVPEHRGGLLADRVRALVAPSTP